MQRPNYSIQRIPSLSSTVLLAYETSCCGMLPTNITPLAFALEGVVHYMSFRGSMKQLCQKVPRGNNNKKLTCQRPKAFKNWSSDIAVRS